MVHGRRSTIAEDRISNLPDDIIHRILGFLDMKSAIQTSKLSRKWKHIWTSMPHLNLDSHTFCGVSQFGKFVKGALSHRKNGTDVSSVKLAFTEETTSFAVKRVIKYAYSHNVQQLAIVWTAWKWPKLPQHFFSCHTLKHLTLRYIQVGSPSGFHSHVPKTAWDFPALETLNLRSLRFGECEGLDSVNLFSKCVKLKDLTLHDCSMSGVLNFNVCAPQLLNLTITGFDGFPIVIDVVAPQLENFTASIMQAPHDFLLLSTRGLDFLEKVNLSLSWTIENNKRILPPLLDFLDLFKKLRSAKFLILDAGMIEALWLCMDELSYEPCPFNNLKCLKIDMAPVSSDIDRRDRIAKKVPQVRQYLLENSPDATFLIEIPQVPPMRGKRPMHPVLMMAKLDVPTAPKTSSSDVPHQTSRQEVHNVATITKTENLEIQDNQQESRPEDKRMLEGKLQMLQQVIAKQKAKFEAKIQMQDEVSEKRLAIFKARFEIQDKVIVEQKEKIQMQDEVIAKQKAMYEAKTQMVEATKLQNKKLMSLIIKSKIAELKVKIESENPDHEVIHSTGIDMISLMDLVPESLRVNLEARFSSMYEGFKSLLLTHIDDSQWEKIESQLEKDYNGFLE